MKAKILLSIFIVLIFSALSFSVSMKKISLEQSIENSNHIVGVTCLENTNDNTQKFPYTYTKFKVDFVIHGDIKVGEEFTVKQLGGYSIGKTSYPKWFKHFEENDKLVLVLANKKNKGYVIKAKGVMPYKEVAGSIVIPEKFLKSLSADLRPAADMKVKEFKNIVKVLKKKK